MKLIIGLLLFTNLAQSEVIRCSTRTLDSVCGSGLIELSMNIENKTYQLRNGDIRCWGQDVLTSGSLINSNLQRYAYNSLSFKLHAEKRYMFDFNNEGHEIDPISIAKIEYSRQQSSLFHVVYLEYLEGLSSSLRGIVKGTYLECE